jgi:rRNA processing protein Krr1/Pno1
MVKKTISVPSTSVGMIIGKAGSNIKRISSESGARCSVKDSSVEIIGTTPQIEHAERLILQVVHNSIAVYEHPEAAFVALDGQLNSNKEYTVQFFSFAKENRSANHQNKDVFQVRLKISDSDEVSNLMSKLSVSRDDSQLVKEGGICLFQDNKEELMNKFLDVVKQAHSKLEKSSTVTSRLKVVAALGSTTFYSSRKNTICSRKEVPLARFKNYQVGLEKDVKVTFNNGVAENVSRDVQQSTENWEYLEDKVHISMHLIDEVQNKRYTASLIRDGADGLKLRKFRIKQIKHIFLNIVRVQVDGTNGLRCDVRLRLNQTDAAEPSQAILDFVKQLRFDDAHNKIVVPQKSSYRVDVARFKQKKRKISNGIKISCNKITEGANTNNEVLLQDVNLNATLQEDLLDTKKVHESLQNLLAESFELIEKISN